MLFTVLSQEALEVTLCILRSILVHSCVQTQSGLPSLTSQRAQATHLVLLGPFTRQQLAATVSCTLWPLTAVMCTACKFSLVITAVHFACQGYGVVRELETVATEASDKPTYDCFIRECGQLEANADLSPSQEVSSARFSPILHFASPPSPPSFPSHPLPTSTTLLSCSAFR